MKRAPNIATWLETKCPPVPSLVNARKPLPTPNSESPPTSFNPSEFCQKLIAFGSNLFSPAMPSKCARNSVRHLWRAFLEGDRLSSELNLPLYSI